MRKWRNNLGWILDIIKYIKIVYKMVIGFFCFFFIIRIENILTINSFYLGAFNSFSSLLLVFIFKLLNLYLLYLWYKLLCLDKAFKLYIVTIIICRLKYFFLLKN